MPTIDELQDKLVRATILSKFNLKYRYHQIWVKEEDVNNTIFRTQEGNYKLLVMLLGLTNAHATFQGLMNVIFKPYLRKFVLVFFDNILIYNKGFKDHLWHL